MWSRLGPKRSPINFQSPKGGVACYQCEVSSLRNVSRYYTSGFYRKYWLFKYYLLLRQDGWLGSMSQRKKS
jgi:hypothetical protein